MILAKIKQNFIFNLTYALFYKVILPGSNIEEVKEFISHLNQYVKDGHLTPLSSNWSTVSAETEEFDFI